MSNNKFKFHATDANFISRASLKTGLRVAWRCSNCNKFASFKKHNKDKRLICEHCGIRAFND